MPKIHIHIHGGHPGSRGLKTHAERSIAQSHEGQGKLGTGEPKAREHDSDKGQRQASKPAGPRGMPGMPKPPGLPRKMGTKPPKPAKES